MQNCKVVNGHYEIEMLVFVSHRHGFCPVCHSDVTAQVCTGPDGIEYQVCLNESCSSVYPLDLAQNPAVPTMMKLVSERREVLGIPNFRAVA